MFKMVVIYHDRRRSEFLCQSTEEGFKKLKTIHGYIHYRFIKLN